MGQKHSSQNRKKTNDRQQEVSEAVKYATDILTDGEDLSSKVELSISCTGLTGHIHGRVAVWIKRSASDAWIFVADTEDISSSSKLEFVRSILIDFSFEVQTNIRFELYRLATIGEDELVGVGECYLVQLLAVNGGSSTFELFVPDALGRVTSVPCLLAPTLEVFAEETAHSLNSMSFDVSIQLFEKQKSFWLQRPNSYYMTLSRTKLADPNGAITVYRSEALSKKQFGDAAWLCWKDIQVNTEKLCRGSPWRPIELKVFDKKGRLVGCSLMAAVDFDNCARCFRPSRLFYHLLGGSSKHVGASSVKVNQVVQQYSFLDYVLAGLEICVMVGIDFTRSNDDPRSPASLHAFVPSTDETGNVVYIPGPRNDYALVLRTVLEVLQQYDSDKQIPVYGFGAKLPPFHTTTSHCFALSGDYFKPEVAGLEGVFRVYQEALGSVTMHGPTRFSEILQLAGQYAEPLLGTAKYCILLLITDGVIEDFQASVDEIVTLANLPLSIVIVGVGEEDFSQMRILDADDHPLVSSVTGATMHRDIVQFVPFSEFKDASYSELARATLEEIPREVVNYFSEKRIYPQLKLTDTKKVRKYTGFSGLENTRKSADFLSVKKAELVRLVTEQGYDAEVVNRVVNNAGVLCPDPMHVLDVMFHLHKHKIIRPFKLAAHRSIADRLGVSDFLAPEEEGKKTKSSGQVSSTAGQCGVCYMRRIDIELRNCGHQVVCRKCFDDLPPICPLCRGVVSGTIPITN